MSWRVHTYAEWQSYLANGRKKWERTLYDGQRNRIQYANKFNKTSDIQIVNQWTNRHPLITIHPDDTMTLQGGQVSTHWGGSFNCLDSQSMRYTIWKYAGIQVNRRNFKFYITERDAAFTPSKTQGCRMCRQIGKIDGWCNPPTCFVGSTAEDGTFICPDHPGAQPSNNWRKYHQLECSHNQTDSHLTKLTEMCWSCNGLGKRDYGNKKVSVLWDGSPIRVQNGNIVKQPMNELERMVAAYVGSQS